MDDKKRISTRLSNSDYLFINAMASVNNESISSYLKRKLFESQTKLTDDQIEKIVSSFNKRVDPLRLYRVEQGIIELMKSVTAGEITLTYEEHSALLCMNHDLKEIKKGVDEICQLYMQKDQHSTQQ